jgi:nicotinate-nucleotide adenylyltransferase
MERIGIYGGTFNPPHIGHIRAAQSAARTLKLDKLLLIPGAVAPHKQLPADMPTPQQRLDMLRLAVGDDPVMEVSDLEIRRGGISYTWETVLQVRADHPDAEIFLLMGSDMFRSFQTWKQVQTILENTTLAVFGRGEKAGLASLEDPKAELEKQGHPVYVIEHDAVNISSTQLRRLLAFGCTGGFLPEGVETYIRENGLYHINADWKQLPMEQLEQVVVSLLKPDRVAHVLGCRDAAAELARHWGADQTDAARAGILHDITKALDGPLQLTLCSEYGTILDDFSRRYPKTLHALTGSLVAQRIFGENDCVVAAIRHHTTGRADMSLLEKIIYVADYIEPNRELPYVQELRELAYTDLDRAVLLGLGKTLEYLNTTGAEVSPASQAAVAFLMQACGDS